MNVTLRVLAVALAGTSIAPIVVHAKLVFPEPVIRLKPKEGEKTLSATYVFTNTGPEAIDVLKVESSCGCLVPAINKNHFEPNESGTISTSYDIGVNEGAIKQTLTVITAEKTENAYILTFRADLPPALKGALPPADPVKPRLIYWMKKPFEAKTVVVDLKTVQGSKFSVVCDAPDAFRVETDAPDGAGEAKITITPVSTATARGELTVTLETTDGKKVPYNVALRTLGDKVSAAQ